jgi:hypothetical protein
VILKIFSNFWNSEIAKKKTNIIIKNTLNLLKFFKWRKSYVKNLKQYVFEQFFKFLKSENLKKIGPVNSEIKISKNTIKKLLSSVKKNPFDTVCCVILLQYSGNCKNWTRAAFESLPKNLLFLQKWIIGLLFYIIGF